MRNNWGLPYKGSKNTIAEWIVSKLPSSDTFVDLFAGGCAITHAALESGKFHNVIANDINNVPSVFEYFYKKNEKLNYIEDYLYTFCDRATFNRLKTINPFIAIIWSFNSNTEDYIYSKDIEEEERLLFNKVIQSESRLKLFSELKSKGEFEKAIYNERVFPRIERAKTLKNSNKLNCELTILKESYESVKIPEGSVVYCDIPYINTVFPAGKKFNHAAFYEWCRKQPFDVYISEYTMPEDFEVVGIIEKTTSCFAKRKTNTIEKLFVHRGIK